jgi:adenylate kinase family enzyme
MAGKRQSTQKTFQLSIEAGQKADQALLMYGTKASLAANLQMSRTTITNFFACRDVDQAKFKKICRELKLKWEEVIVREIPADSGIDRLVQEVRSQIEPKIRSLCGTMRVLDMDQPIELTGDRGIYTNVNILEKLTRLRSEREVREHCGIEDFGRLELGRVIGEPIPGLEAVEKHPRLMVLGKPGAGKTTFLKYLAMQCVTGGLAAEKVPFFVTLKDFAEAPKGPSLVEYLVGLLPKGLTGETVERLLAEGRSLVLLDGLDEVREEDTKRVIREMRETADRFGASQFVVTCRIAAKEYVFERFTEVEVADFDELQIEAFVGNWFRAKNDVSKADRFLKRLKEQKPIRELATSPLLLTLLCLVFGEEGDFPSNRSDLYAEGVKVLLKKWDSKRNIERDDQYKKLDVQRREDLLSYLALKTFQEKEYFVRQRRMESYIAEFIGNLRDIDPDPESLRCDSEVVLKSIQAQHGLLVERARGIYSFSHLTFQEYFTAREIVTTNNIEAIVQNIRDPHWREVFFLALGMLRNADEMLLKIKSHIDSFLASSLNLQWLLKLVKQHSSSVKSSHKPTAIRAFYLGALCRPFLRLQNRMTGIDLQFVPDLDKILGRLLLNLFSLDDNINIDININFDLHLFHALGGVNDRDFCQNFDWEHQLQQALDQILNGFQGNQEQSMQWWETNGKQWTAELYQVMITYCNIGQDWQVTDQERQLLQQYYDANLLLVQLLNSDCCYVSRHVRESIEETLLLPMEELRMKNVELRE